MARKGDGIYLRGSAWWLDFRHKGERHQVSLGRNIKRSVAKELATVKRGQILRGEEGIGKKRKDLSFDKAKAMFLESVEANNRYHTVRSYRNGLNELEKTFGGKNLS
jgi:hypothetical protein